MTDLSPAARAVLYDAHNRWLDVDDDIPAQVAAAALRAAADQVLAVQWEGRIEPDTAHSLGINWTRDALHAIAAELEASNG